MLINIKKNLAPSINLDKAQSQLITEIEQAIYNRFFKNKLLRFFQPNPKYGIYIYSGVGRGKTIIIKALFSDFPQNKLFYHYQEFIRLIHNEAHKLYPLKLEDPIKHIAQQIAKDARLLCIDEFEIKDITDAMLISRLTAHLIRLNVFIVFTSNTAPGELYRDGLQREGFMPFIELVEQKFIIHELKSPKDYRIGKLTKEFKPIIYQDSPQASKDSYQKVDNLINSITTSAVPITLEVFGRKISFKNHYKGVLVSSVEELFHQELSYNDFSVISKSFKAVIIPRINKFESEGSDIVMRFIYFIDNLYLNKSLLMTKFEIPLNELYNGNKYSKEFQRTISRLIEMNNEEYITHSKYNSYDE